MAYSAVGSNDVDPVLERTLLLKQEATIYKIPPNQVNIFIQSEKMLALEGVLS